MSSGGGMAPQNMTDSLIHLPALSPRRQVLTNGKPRFQVTQAGGMSGSHTLKPKQQEFGSPFTPNPGKGRIVFLGSFKSENYFFSLPCPVPERKFYRKIHNSMSESKFMVSQ
jgi:zinc finger protein GLIS1/3